MFFQDRGRLELLSREAEGLGRQVVNIRRELSLGRPEEAVEVGIFGRGSATWRKAKML